MKFIKQYYWFIIVIAAAVYVTKYTLGNIVTHPFSTLHELGGDGIKNYFVYVTHALYGNGFWFDKMNYPYGEHLVFTDGLPIFSVPLTWIRSFVPLTISNVTALLNTSLALGMVIGILYAYKILTKFNVNRVFALIAACCILAISPQVTRVFGHYGLGFLCVIPMTFYFFLCYYNTNNNKYVLYLTVLYVLLAFAHPYYIALIMLWTLVYAVLIAVSKYDNKWRHIVKLVFIPLLAMCVFKIVLAQTDTVADRPANPLGTLSACTTGLDIFTSNRSPVWQSLQEKGIVEELGPHTIEGDAYTGIVPLIVLIVYILFAIKNKLIRRKKGEDSDVTLWLGMAVLFLLAGMGAPFVWKMDWLLDYLSVFKQFRSLGRFSLLYYNIAAIAAAVILYRFCARLAVKKKWLGYGLAIVLCSIWIYEANSFAVSHYKKSLGGSYNYSYFTSDDGKDWKSFLQNNNYARTDFQAIMIVPYFGIGSEKLWLMHEMWGGFCIGTKASYQLQLPLIANSMSRSSWQTTFKHIKNSSGPFGDRPILADMSSRKDFLLLDYDEHNKTPDEQFYISLADRIGHYDQYTVYALSYDKLVDGLNNAKRYVRQIADSMHVGDTSFTGSAYYYNHFDDGAADKYLFGKAAKEQFNEERGTLLNIDAKPLEKGVQYEFSVWTLVNDYDYKAPAYELRCYNEQGQQIQYNQFVVAHNTYDNQGFWFRTSGYLEIPIGTASMEFRIRDNGEDVYYAMDELLIKQANDTIVSKDDSGNLMINNHLQTPHIDYMDLKN